MITAKEAREITVTNRQTISGIDIYEQCIQEAALQGLTSTEVFSMPDEIKTELIKNGYKVEITNIPNDPRIVCGWTISW